jgi:pyruvate dehydrogenase E1 component alpha subunit
MYNEIPENVALSLYRTMVRIRKFEQAVSELYARGKIPGFLHTYVGEEAVAAGVCANLLLTDKIISTHRGHGHLIAKGGELDLMMAELFGKGTGYNKGKGGSMHIAEPDLGMLGANAIVGAGAAIINGAAFTAMYLGTGGVAAAFFGDGATNTGTFHEAMNLAAVWNLPSIFVCENNGYAESTPRWQHQKIKDIAVRAQAYDMPAVTVDGNDVGAVYLASKQAVARARNNGGPTFIECQTTRWRGHHEADQQQYRPKDELAALENRDAIRDWRKVLVARGIPEAELDAIDAEVAEELQNAVAFAEAAPHPDPSEAYTDIFTPVSEELYA